MSDSSDSRRSIIQFFKKILRRGNVISAIEEEKPEKKQALSNQETVKSGKNSYYYERDYDYKISHKPPQSEESTEPLSKIHTKKTGKQILQTESTKMPRKLYALENSYKKTKSAKFKNVKSENRVQTEPILPRKSKTLSTPESFHVFSTKELPTDSTKQIENMHKSTCVNTMVIVDTKPKLPVEKEVAISEPDILKNSGNLENVHDKTGLDTYMSNKTTEKENFKSARGMSHTLSKSKPQISVDLNIHNETDPYKTANINKQNLTAHCVFRSNLAEIQSGALLNKHIILEGDIYVLDGTKPKRYGEENAIQDKPDLKNTSRKNLTTEDNVPNMTDKSVKCTSLDHQDNAKIGTSFVVNNELSAPLRTEHLENERQPTYITTTEIESKRATSKFGKGNPKYIISQKEFPESKKDLDRSNRNAFQTEHMHANNYSKTPSTNKKQGYLKMVPNLIPPTYPDNSDQTTFQTRSRSIEKYSMASSTNEEQGGLKIEPNVVTASLLQQSIAKKQATPFLSHKTDLQEKRAPHMVIKNYPTRHNAKFKRQPLSSVYTITAVDPKDRRTSDDEHVEHTLDKDKNTEIKDDIVNRISPIYDELRPIKRKADLLEESTDHMLIKDHPTWNNRKLETMLQRLGQKQPSVKSITVVDPKERRTSDEDHVEHTLDKEIYTEIKDVYDEQRSIMHKANLVEEQTEHNILIEDRPTWRNRTLIGHHKPFNYSTTAVAPNDSRMSDEHHFEHTVELDKDKHDEKPDDTAHKFSPVYYKYDNDKELRFMIPLPAFTKASTPVQWKLLQLKNKLDNHTNNLTAFNPEPVRKLNRCDESLLQRKNSKSKWPKNPPENSQGDSQSQAPPNSGAVEKESAYAKCSYTDVDLVHSSSITPPSFQTIDLKLNQELFRSTLPVYAIKVYDFNGFLLTGGRTFEPWTPIPSWPFSKRRPPPAAQFPKHGCPTPPPPKDGDFCKPREKTCTGFPKRDDFSKSDCPGYEKLWH